MQHVGQEADATLGCNSPIYYLHVRDLLLRSPGPKCTWDEVQRAPRRAKAKQSMGRGSCRLLAQRPPTSALLHLRAGPGLEGTFSKEALGLCCWPAQPSPARGNSVPQWWGTAMWPKPATADVMIMVRMVSSRSPALPHSGLHPLKT